MVAFIQLIGSLKLVAQTSPIRNSEVSDYTETNLIVEFPNIL